MPISISVLSGDKLDSAGVSSVNEAIGRLPGVAVYQTFQGNGSKFSIRGVSASPSIFSGSGTTAYYMDEVPFALVKTPLTPDASAHDLDRVEVLKASARYAWWRQCARRCRARTDQRCKRRRLRSQGSGGISATEHGGDNYKGDIAVNVPLIAGKLAIRAVASYEDLSGWVDRPPRFLEKTTNSLANRILSRESRAKPTDRLTANLSAWISRRISTV